MWNRRGFTLVELLVVIGIIGALLGLAMQSMSAAIQANKAVVCMNNLRQMGNGILMYANEHKQHLPYVIEPLWQTDGSLNFNADPSAEPQSLMNVLKPYVPDVRVYLCPSQKLEYPTANPMVSYRVSSANNFDGQPRTLDYLITPSGPRYEYSLKYLNGRPYRQWYIDSTSYPFKLMKGVGPFYVIRDFVNLTPAGAFAPPHPRRLYNQLMLDMSVTSERDARFSYTYP